ncbi:MAG TPA: hypothetical protein VLS90_19740, partial [Thermodesulfobacteriota bacterium]|nr:hypothetical protein [Thermodesulfobacteriota bacterium]
VFVVWLPTVLVFKRILKGMRQKDFWKAVLRACPFWMRMAIFFFVAYALINFAVFVVFDSSPGGGSATSAAIFRMFSGYWMVFYYIAASVLYSAIHVREYDSARRCPNGHLVPHPQSSCDRCGAAVAGSKLVE